MLDYIFFDEGLRGRFVAALDGFGVPCRLGQDDTGFTAAISEELDDEVMERIDALYDELLAENAALLESEEGGVEKHMAGVTAQLADGGSCVVPIEPQLMGRLLEVFTLEELRDFVQRIVVSVETRENRTLCKF